MKVSLDLTDTRIKWSMVKLRMIWKFAPLLPSKNSIVNGYFSLIVTVFSIILYLFFLSRRLWFPFQQPVQSICPSKQLWFSICFTPMWTVNYEPIFRRSATSYTYKKKSQNNKHTLVIFVFFYLLKIIAHGRKC